MRSQAFWIWCSWVLLHLPILYMTSIIVDSAYMDEMFHFRQVIAIHDYPTKYEWDPKITTPSGLYWVTLILTGWLPPTLYILRTTSVVFNAASLAVCFLLMRKRSAAMDKSLASSWLSAVKIMTFPPLFFIGQMYYTDPGGLFFVLASWLAQAHQKLGMSVVLGGIALWFRQTNAIWVLFIGGIHFCERLMPALGKPDAFDWNDLQKSVFHSDKFRLKRTIMECAGYVLIPVSYVLLTFLTAKKGSLVHGDEANHQLSLHWAQLCYLSLIITWFSGLALVLAMNLKEALQTIKNNLMWLAALTVFNVCAVHWFSITHPFVLADNRHFTFYIWSKFFRRFWFAKYSLVPAYTLAMFFTFRQLLRGTKSLLVSIGFCICAMLSLVPLPLVEPRYFIVPLVVYCLLTVEAQSNAQRDWCAVGIILGNVIINTAVAFLFWFRPFNYTDGSIARFMW